MKAVALALMLTVTASVMPASADEHEGPQLPPDWATRFAALALVIPVTLALIGEFNQRACEASGFEFLEADMDVGPGGHWYCTGLPRPADDDSG